MRNCCNPRLRFKRADGTDYPDWEEKKLGEVCNIYDGTHQTPNYTKTGIKFVSVENINDLYSSQKFISEEDFEKNYKIYPQKGDILMTRIGDIGTPALVSKDEKIAFYVSLALFKPNNIINPKFFVQVLQSNFVRQEFWIRTLHTAFPKKINKKDIGICKLFLPCLEEQEKIADCLSAFDDLISIYNKQLKNLEELKKGVMQKIFSQEVRFKRDDGTDYPDWEKDIIENICSIVDYRGKTPKKVKSGIFLVTAKNIRMGFIDYECSKEYILPNDYEEVMHRGKVNIGDVLITTEAPFGNVAQVDRADIALAQRVIKYSSKIENLNNTYLKYYLMSKYFQDILDKLSTGGTVKGIKGSILHKQEVFLPCLEEQEKIADCLSAFDEAIKIKKEQIKTAKDLKKGLLQQMFT